jgi:hypothetical protein
MTRPSIYATLSLLLLLGIGAGPAMALDPDRVRWSALEFGAYLLFVPLSAEVQYRRAPAQEARAQFYDPEGRPLIQPSSEEVAVLTMTSDNLGRRATQTFWFEPDLTALEIDKQESGRRNYVKTYRYAEDGVYRRDRRPLEGEAERPPEAWSKIEHHEYPHPAALDGARISDNAVLFYAASAAELDAPGDRLAFYTFGKKQLSRVELVVEAVEEIEVSYTEVGPQGERRVSGPVEALRIAINPGPATPGGAAGEFEFLGLEEDVRVFVDPVSRLPLRVTAGMDIVGSVDIDLRRARMAP